MKTKRLSVDQHIEAIKKMYFVDKMSLARIGKIFEVSHTAILDCMERFKVSRRTKTEWGKEKRIYTHDESYFETIDTAAKAYILGFLFADGYNGVYKRFIVLKIQEGDRNVIDLMARDLKTDSPIKTIISKKPNNKNMVILKICGKKISTDLENLGMIQAKSLIVKFPTSAQVPDNLLHHFVRGYFDGDGCICLPKGKATNVRVSLCLSLEFGIRLKDILLTKLGINSHLVKQSAIHRLDCAGRQNCLKFLKWMYKDSGEYFLPRKHDKFLEVEKHNTKMPTATSKYFGVYFVKKKNRYHSGFYFNNKKIHLGTFKNEIDAAKRYNQYLLDNKIERQLNVFDQNI